MDNKKYWFFGSKLNTVLLAILIILMVVALWFMHENKQIYLLALENIQNKNTEPLPKSSILGNSSDLVFLSVVPGTRVSGVVDFTGEVKGGYFFEGNILINILDANKKVLSKGHGTATAEWMTSNAVPFKTTVDFTKLPKGKGYLEIHNDNPSGLTANDKSILIPIIIE